MSNFMYSKATILTQRRGDREDKELLPRSILEIIRPREVCKVWQWGKIATGFWNFELRTSKARTIEFVGYKGQYARAQRTYQRFTEGLTYRIDRSHT